MQLTPRWRLRLAAFGALLAGLAHAPAQASDAEHSGVLAAYVAKPDESFAWREVRSGKVGSAEYVEYLMTSQTWRDAQWKHQLFVLRPANAAPQNTQALLFVHGGRWKPEYETMQRDAALPREALLFARLAEAIGSPVGVLRQVPFAPLFDRKDDALIAYTFDRYLETGESDWPLLLPMVKSAVRAMDVIQAAAKERWGADIDSFTVAGASKRGWTAWLTAAVDPRVNAVAPIVIDVLNMRAQMAHQRATWGEVSDEIEDYSAFDLPGRLATERGRQLLSIVDPYSYRKQLTRPKLILLSTNDRYWPLDALSLYWPELPDPKHVLYVPNQGHGLTDVDRVIGALSAVHRYTSRGEMLPQLTWDFDGSNETLSVAVRTDHPPRQVVFWSARSPTRDFRDARWRSHACKRDGERYACTVKRASDGYTAAFAEASFEDPGAPSFSLTTTVCLVHEADEFEGCK